LAAVEMPCVPSIEKCISGLSTGDETPKNVKEQRASLLMHFSLLNSMNICLMTQKLIIE